MLKTILIIMVKSFITKMVQNDYCCGVGHVVGISTLSPPKILVTSIIFLQLLFLVIYGHHILDYFCLF
jgi:hypothetical protein